MQGADGQRLRTGLHHRLFQELLPLNRIIRCCLLEMLWSCYPSEWLWKLNESEYSVKAKKIPWSLILFIFYTYMCIWDIISVIKDPSLISVCCYIYTDKGVNNVPSGFYHSPPLLYSKTTVLNEPPYRHHSGIYQSGRKFGADSSPMCSWLSLISSGLNFHVTFNICISFWFLSTYITW